MDSIVIIVVVLLVLGITPLFILLGISIKDLLETRKQIQQNEKEINEIIYGNEK